MTKRAFVLQPLPHPSRQRAIDWIKQAPDGYLLVVQEPTRSLEQNAAQWPLLEEISKLKQWPVNGANVWLTPEEWKDILTAAFEQDTGRMALGLNGGIVLLGRRTREYGKKKFSEWLDFLNSVLAKFQAEVSE